MKSALIIAGVVLTATSSVAQLRQGTPPTSGTAVQGDQDVIQEGELETFIAIGGETTGWRLRRRTSDGKREYTEVLLTAEMAQGIRSNTRVRIRGTMKTRHYVERGDVQVLVAKEVIEVARTR